MTVARGPDCTGNASLRILATTDLHAKLRPFDYLGRREDVSVGLSRVATLVQRLREEAECAILVDNGDFLTGGMLGEQSLDEFAADGVAALPNAVITAMNLLAYDAAALGNHEFNRGIDSLRHALGQAAFPVLSANIVTRLGARPREDAPLTRAWCMIERTLRLDTGGVRAIRVGVIGFTPPQILQWDRRLLEGRVAARDIVEAARDWVPMLRGAGADLVVALCHSGIAAPGSATGDAENVALDLAAIGGIDAMILGHRHLVFPGPDYAASDLVDPAGGHLAGIPAVMPGCWGRQLGMIDLDLAWQANGWRVTGDAAICHPVASRRPDGTVRPLVGCAPEILRVTEPVHSRALRRVSRPVGRIDRPLTTYFAQLGRSRAVELVARAQRFCVAQLVRATPDAELPIIGIAAPVRCGGRGGPENYIDVPSGPLIMGDVAALYNFPNRVAAVRVSGAILRDWLERSVSVFARIRPGARDARLLDPRFPGFDLDLPERVTFTVDLSRPARYGPKGIVADATARRVEDLRFCRMPVRDGDTFLMATNEFRALGAGHFPGTGGDRLALHSDIDVQEAIVRLLVNGRTTGLAGRTFSFAPMYDTSVVLETGPGAVEYLHDLEGLDVTPRVGLPSGFARFRLNLETAALEVAAAQG